MSPLLGDPQRESVATPSRFGPYDVVREIGRGGMAFVYEGRHPKLESRVALKVLHPVLAAQPSSAARFLREAKAASQIRHQNIVEVFDVGVQDGLPFIVMEFLEGSDLATLLANNGPMPLSGVVEIFLPVISAVATAHRAGVVHRDLKPANLMLARRPPWSYQPVVLDFGISKVQNDDLDESKLTRSESLLGTVPYMAPEVTRGAKLATAASDQYAVGVMLYECATGRRPFSGESQYELMHAIVTAKVPPPSSLRPTLPTDFDELVMTAMHRDPKKRHASLEELGSALLALGGAASWAQWKDVFLAGAQERNPWIVSGMTLSDADSLSVARSPKKRLRKAGVIGWGLLATAFIVTGATFVLLPSRRATGSDQHEGVAPPSAENATPPPAAPVEVHTAVPVTASTTTIAATPPVVEPVPSGIAPSSSSMSRRRAAPVHAALVFDTNKSATPPATSAPPTAKAAPVRGTNGAPIFE